jgi:predicted dinucleotide-binding enzyme
MKMGVLGTGVVGQTLGSKLVHLGHEVMMGGREADNPKAVAWAKDEGGIHALFGTFANAAEFGEIIFNCTLGVASLSALRMAGEANLKDKILIDTSNPLDYRRISGTSRFATMIRWANKSGIPHTFVVKSSTHSADVMVDHQTFREPMSS